MSEKKVVYGICTEVSEKASGWVQFSIDIGSKYPISLSTKKQEIIDVARAAHRSQSHMAWHFNESESDRINEKSGRPYLNRYLESVLSPEDNGGSASTPEYDSSEKTTKADWAAKDRRIARESVLKTASTLVPHMDFPDGDVVAGVFRIAARMETWIYRDMDPIPSNSGTEMPQESDEGSLAALAAQEDDIPF